MTAPRPPNTELQQKVRDRVEQLDRETAEAWGGDVRSGVPTVHELPLDPDYSDRTVVQSPRDGLDAFEKYTAFYQYVRETVDTDHDTAIFIPCGKQKPIGVSAIQQKKLAALRDAGLWRRADLYIVSEPCTIIPHEMRLTMPAVNYDFPPEYTTPDDAPRVFSVFVDRLADFLETTAYDTVYPYLVAGHQVKFDAAIEKARVDPTVIEVPGASYNPETDAYSGDVFKSVDQVADKLRAIQLFNDPAAPDNLRADITDAAYSFYQDRAEFHL